MYETTLSVPQNNKNLLQFVVSQISPFWNDVDGILSQSESETRSFCSVACSDTYRFQCKRLLKESLASALAVGYKNLYVRRILQAQNCNFFQNVLINIMCAFDSWEDKEALFNILDVEHPVFLDGYFNFKMGAMKNKWQDVARLVSHNCYILQNDDLIFEFLKYLMESVSNKVSTLSVTLEQGSFLMYDAANNVLPVVPSLAPIATTEEEAALNILLLKPKKVKVFCSSKPSQEFSRVLDLFSFNISIVQ